MSATIASAVRRDDSLAPPGGAAAKAASREGWVRSPIVVSPRGAAQWHNDRVCFENHERRLGGPPKQIYLRQDKLSVAPLGLEIVSPQTHPSALAA